ncbi:hypothetical protein LY90DRAFT_676535 [Neocallimastix californiae]|uniref:Protein PBN1 n=1 Tax=Neocallimastix californiae TaxID=1754190 RepID=A0A1Y2AE96_9FUNG|nr:hypothetical protein LY90DRAFT_676535 [Neocallimastix californiae]|eukprot:ORY20903.1 hypothetical protein LY90DRAFT_676535 [Neocallimastix californiae]
MLNRINSFSILFIFLTSLKLTFAITQEWLFWPSNNSTLIVNSAENKSKIKNENKSETLHFRYSITDEIEKFISLPSITLNGNVASIDMTYISSEMQFKKELSMDKNFMPLFGTYETGLHIAITTNEDMKGREVVQKFMEDNCDFVNQLFQGSGYSLCQKEDYLHFKNLIKMAQISPRYFYMFLSDFTLEDIDGFSLYHIFKLSEKSDLELGCDFDDEAISEWTSKYFNIVISSQRTMLNDKDENDNEEGEKENTLMMKFEEILHLQFPETVQCNVNQHLSEIKYIGNTTKSQNKGYTITTINPRGVKNDELVFLPCPMPKVNFNFKLNPGVGLHPILFTTVEVNNWVENQPLVMLLTFDPNIFADEYQISDQKYEKNVQVSVLGHPDLEVAVNDPQAKFNYVKVIFDALAPKANITLEIPFHVRYPESEPIESLLKKQNKEKEGEQNQKEEDEDEDIKKENQDNDTLNSRLYKAIFIQPPRFYTTSTKLCNQDSYSSTNLPMRLLSSINKKSNSKNNVSIIPVQVLPGKSSKSKEDREKDEEEKEVLISTKIISPLRMDIPKGQLADYSIITIITTIITVISIVLIFLWIIKYSNSSITAVFELSSEKPKNIERKKNNIK